LLQREVAEQLGVAPATVTNWERQRTIPEVRLVPKIIDFLGYAMYDPTERVGQRLRASRTALGLSQREVAKLLGVDPKAVWEWETGLREPSRRSKQRIIQFLRGSSGFR